MNCTGQIMLPENIIEIMKKEYLLSIEGKPLTISIDWDKDWKGAYCKELAVSGFGKTIEESLASLAISINSSLAVCR